VARNLTLIGLLLAAMLNSWNAGGVGPQKGLADPAVQTAQEAVQTAQQSVATRYCYTQYRGSGDVMRCLQAKGL
jgi:hypothetical protein